MPSLQLLQPSITAGVESNAFELTIAKLHMNVDRLEKLYQSELVAIRSENERLKRKCGDSLCDGKETLPTSADVYIPQHHATYKPVENTQTATGAQGNTDMFDDRDEADRQDKRMSVISEIAEEGQVFFQVSEPTCQEQIQPAQSASQCASVKQTFRTREAWTFEPWMRGINIMIRVIQEKQARHETLSKLGSVVAEPSIIEKKKAELHMRGPWYILLPESKGVAAWMLLCMILLLYDLVVLPIDFCFDMQAAPWQQHLDVVSAVFWTVDMVMSFFTGRHHQGNLELRPAHIRRLYLKSWFAFDVSVLIADYMSLLINVRSSIFVLLRIARIRRFVRLLRVARILRLSKLRTIVRRSAILLHMSRTYIQLTNGLIGMSLMIIAFLHFVSCIWYMLGNGVEGGWVARNNLGSASVGRAYAISLHWSFSRMHGLASPYMVESTSEMILETVLIYLNLILACVYSSVLVTVCLARVNVNSRHLWSLSAAYGKRHAISMNLKVSLTKFLESLSYAGAREITQEEDELLNTLPSSLRDDLLFETRVPFLLVKPFLKDCYYINARVVFHICIDAMQVRVFSLEEVVFAHCDHCHWMLFLTDGRLSYLNDVTAHSRMSRMPDKVPGKRPTLFPAHSSHEQVVIKTLEAGSSISEAVLWTKWTHIWRLVASLESMTLVLDPEAFAASTSVHETSAIHASKYARHFVRCLNLVDEPDDLVAFDDLRIEQLDDADNVENLGDIHRHFLFLSHYKVEAGTEATLIRDLLNDILNQYPDHPAHDFPSPIFIDSEDLADIADLRQHVRMTTAFVLLLTPGVLSRPWCLVELVTAVEQNIDIVLVDIQRPGSRYRYPDDEFYANLLAGKFLSQGAVDLLNSEGITLHDVEKAIRQVFLKIALPFSPHKSKTIREAELIGILKRCSPGNEFCEGLFSFSLGSQHSTRP